MSNNMIKGFSINYDHDKIKKLDTTEREEKLYEKLREIKEEKDRLEENFREGITAEKLDENGEVISEEEPKQKGISQEELEAYKESLREELTAQIREELTEKIRMEIQAELDELVSEAKNNAESIIEAARKKGEEEGEAAKAGIISLASTQGYEDGLKRAKEENQHREDELKAEAEQLKADYERQVSELEPAFVEIMGKYMKKITGLQYDRYNEVFMYLLDCGIKSSPRDKEFSVYLSQEDYDRFKTDFDDIKETYAQNLTLSFAVNPELKKGDIVLENNGHMIECGITVNLNGLLDSLSILSESV